MEEVALAYLSRGWSVIPVRAWVEGGRREKRPLIDWKEFQKRRPSEEEVRAWFAQFPKAGVGIVTGAVSGLVVLDVDKGGMDTLLSLVAQYGPLPHGPVVHTPGGQHLYFAHPGRPVPNRVRFLPGLDIRGDGGFVVAPPTRLEGGEGGWEEDAVSPLTLPLPQLPSWLLEHLPEHTPSAVEPSRLASLFRGVPEGERHNALKTLVGHFIAKGISYPILKDILIAWNEKNTPPLEERELMEQLEDMWRRWGGEGTLEESIEAIADAPEEQRFALCVRLVEEAKRRGLRVGDREILRETMAVKLGFPKRSFDAVWRVRAEEPERGAPVVYTKEIQERAKELLLRKDLLFMIFTATREAGVVGEEENSLLVYLAMTSRLLSSPVSVVIKGETSAGKSWLVKRVADLMPEGVVIERSHLSAKALFYTATDLRHKVLYISEITGAQPGDYPIRLIQSENKLIAEVTVRDENAGFVTKSIEKEGPVSIITTTTAVELNPENESREWALHMDDTNEQTARVKEAIALRHSPSWRPPSLEVYKAMQSLLTPRRVYIPIAISQWLRERTPNDPVRMRRDFERLLIVIETVALLHQFQRGTAEHIEADWSDVFLATRILRKTFGKSVSNIPDGSLKLLSALKGLPSPDAPHTIRELAAVLKVSPRTIRRWAEFLINSGSVEKVEKTGRGHLSALRYVCDPVVPSLPDVPEDKLEEVIDPFTGKPMGIIEL